MFFFLEDSNTLKIKPSSVEHAYLLLLEGDMELAKEIFEKLDSPRANWGKSLVEILTGFLEHYPSYFGIRNFLEIDLDFFLKNEKVDYVEMLLGSIDILSGINQESYKYVARVMYENRFYKVAKEYLDKSKDIFYNDAELHFMYAKYYLHFREYEKADFHLDECLKILPDYYPALYIQKEISRYLA
jgi:tetratricopeptide (TPR) repeat protein